MDGENFREYFRPSPTPTEPMLPDYEDLPDVIEEVKVGKVPYHPQAQFLKDVDDDGLIDHLYCCEAASLEYFNNLGKKMDPLDLETHDTLVEYSRFNPAGPDAGWGAAILAIIEDYPIVYGPGVIPKYWSAYYRTPAVAREMKTSKKTVNHDLLVVGIDDKHVYLHCTYNGPCKVTRDNFNSATLMLSTTVDHEPPGKPMKPADTVEYVLEKTGFPVIATVNAYTIKPVEKLGTLPFIVATEDGYREDWVQGLSDRIPPNPDDRRCYMVAIIAKDKLPVYNKAKDDWLKWLEDNQNRIVKPK